MDHSASNALLLLMKGGLVLVVPPIIAGVEARETTFPTANGDLNMALVVLAFTLGPIALLMGLLPDSSVAVRLIAAAMGLVIMYKGARSAWLLRHYVFA